MDTVYDKDGFIQLIKKIDKPEKEKKEQSKETKKDLKDLKNPFKKGSWKARFFKLAKKFRVLKGVEDFHFVKLDNLLVYRNNDPKLVISKTRFSVKELEKIAKKYEESYVLINAYSNTFLKLSIKSYLKLIKINKIVIEYTVETQEDGEDDFFEIYTATEIFDNINALMGFINYYRQLIEGVSEIQARVCNYTWVNFKVKTLVVKQDGSTKTFKGDFNEVMKEYGITPLL